ncbi:MAG: hypothetical protein QNJ92_08075 [Alphaproteobacteria bacterium]|nr:hypothetical protein [Alphaproteobacteria bacterium]
MRTEETIEQIRTAHGWPALSTDELAKVLALLRDLDAQLARMPDLSATEPSSRFSALNMPRKDGA